MDNNKESLRQKLIEMRAKRTKREVIVKKLDKQEEKKKKKNNKEEKNIKFDEEMPGLEDI
jgi:hypothetical protein|tara:strand:+ start:176 stop:355 length:180 start_codon:yes stop_codon:yes gene_type:complete